MPSQPTILQLLIFGSASSTVAVQGLFQTHAAPYSNAFTHLLDRCRLFLRWYPPLQLSHSTRLKVPCIVSLLHSAICKALPASPLCCNQPIKSIQPFHLSFRIHNIPRLSRYYSNGIMMNLTFNVYIFINLNLIFLSKFIH